MSVSEPSLDSQTVQSNSEVNDSLVVSPDDSGEFMPHSQDAHSSENSPKAALAFSILCDLLDECTLDVIFEAHRETKLAASICQICNTECRSFVAQPGLDIFGNHPQPNNSSTFECVNCQRPCPSKRYASHLEKCMGLAGRSSSRVANLRMGNDRNSSSPRTPCSEDNGNQSDSDGSYIDKKRKKINGKSRASSPAKYPKHKKQKSTRTKLKLTSRGSESPVPSSTSGSPLRGQSPFKRSLPIQSSGQSLIDKSKNAHHLEQGENLGFNGLSLPWKIMVIHLRNLQLPIITIL